MNTHTCRKLIPNRVYQPSGTGQEAYTKHVFALQDFLKRTFSIKMSPSPVFILGEKGPT